jgi:hypothetical protein
MTSQIGKGYGEHGGRKAAVEEPAPLNLFARLACLPGRFCRRGRRGSRNSSRNQKVVRFFSTFDGRSQPAWLEATACPTPSMGT